MLNTMEKITTKADAILLFATSYLHKYQAARTTTQRLETHPSAATMASSAPSRLTSKPKWLAPLSERLKLNTDAASNESKGVIGLGALLRDSSSVIVAALSKPL
uniref:Uncharacterized protein n=1 Tax=Cannabis sativa TaxID=3483 RepID=A0A803PZ81_CANSA